MLEHNKSCPFSIGLCARATIPFKIHSSVYKSVKANFKLSNMLAE